MVGLCTVVLVAAALSLAQSVFAPLAFALFVIAIAWPLQRRLQASMPRLLALALTMAATIFVAVVFASLVAWAAGRVGRFVVSDASRLQALYGSIASWLEGHGIEVAGVWANYFSVDQLIRMAQQVTAHLNTAVSFLIVVFIYVLLGLLEVDDVSRKLRAWRRGRLGEVLLAGGSKTAFKFRRYMLVRTLMSAMTGLLVWGFAWLAGLPLAPEWGVIAFALNFIPFIGPLIATVFPTVFAMAQFESWQMAVLVFACLNVIQFVVGSYLEPRFIGNALSISPFVVLFSVFFWTFLWGLAGAFIGVPIVIALLTLCEEHPSTRWIADLLGSPPADRR
ncbi:AI-2E family transporter [Hyphomicrobium sp.]|jgi:predicted PurR-regulated permease PerM|uniref:AI-2E family transporter n=1 Tax=Hyphomicrobium sp. TaxID=82 RepID=UPI00356A997F